MIDQISKVIENLFQSYELEIKKDHFNKWNVRLNQIEKEIPIEELKIPENVPSELKKLVKQALKIKKDLQKSDIKANALHIMMKLKLTMPQAQKIMEYLK